VQSTRYRYSKGAGVVVDIAGMSYSTVAAASDLTVSQAEAFDVILAAAGVQVPVAADAISLILNFARATKLTP